MRGTEWIVDARGCDPSALRDDLDLAVSTMTRARYAVRALGQS